MKYFRPVGNIYCHFKSKQIATKWNGPQNSCLPVFANCHSKILKFSTQRKFGTITNSKTYNFTDPRPYFKSSKKTTPISFFLKEKKKKPILWTPKKMQTNHNYLPQIVSSKKNLQVEIRSSSQSSFFLYFIFFFEVSIGPHLHGGSSPGTDSKTPVSATSFPRWTYWWKPPLAGSARPNSVTVPSWVGPRCVFIL